MRRQRPAAVGARSETMAQNCAVWRNATATNSQFDSSQIAHRNFSLPEIQHRPARIASPTACRPSHVLLRDRPKRRIGGDSVDSCVVGKGGSAPPTRTLELRLSPAENPNNGLVLANAFPTAFNEINDLTRTVDQEVGGSSPPSCTRYVIGTL